MDYNDRCGHVSKVESLIKKSPKMTSAEIQDVIKSYHKQFIGKSHSLSLLLPWRKDTLHPLGAT